LDPRHDSFQHKVRRLKVRAKSFHDRMKRTQLEEAPIAERIGISLYRFFILLASIVFQIELPRRAAALTYTSILSLFPLLALISFTAGVFYTEEKEQETLSWVRHQFFPSVEKEEEIMYPLPPEEDREVSGQLKLSREIEQVFTQITSAFRENRASFGVFGILGLLITAGILYISIESTVNQIWQTTHKGRWVTSLTNFITVIFFAPIIISVSIAGTGIAVAFLDKDVDVRKEFGQDEPQTEQVSNGTQGEADKSYYEDAPPLDNGEDDAPWYTPWIERIRVLTTAFGFLIPIIPGLVNALVLAVAYTFIPRTKVNFTLALLGGAVAAILWEIARYLFFYYVTGSVVNRTLASVLGAPIIFLLWLYVTWIILLTGNVIVYVAQNFRDLWSERMITEKTLLDGRLMIVIMVLLAGRFRERGGGFTEVELRGRLGIPQNYLIELMGKLKARRYISQLEGDAVQIARPPEQIRVRELLDMGCDLNDLPVSRRGGKRIRRVFDWLQDRTLNLVGEDTIDDLLNNGDKAGQPAKEKASAQA